MNYELHVMVNEKLLSGLDKISNELKIKTRSGTIVAIFVLLLPYLEKKQIAFQDNKSQYKLIANMKEKRHHLHAYIPDDIYRKLKELHEFSNFYSIAQILREIIEIYLRDCFKWGVENTRKKFVKLKINWNKFIMFKKGKKFLRQLSVNNHPIPSLTISYDRNFHPFSIKFLS